MALVDFIRESNLIEGIDRDPTQQEIDASAWFLSLRDMTIDGIIAVQAVYQPYRPLRTLPTMNVRVGRYLAPPGGPAILSELKKLIERCNSDLPDPWQRHVEFENLHPFLDGNGRTGRILWAWCMLADGRNPFALPFLHRFYYQTLERRS